MGNIFYGMGGVPDLRKAGQGMGMGGSSIPGLGQTLAGASTYDVMTPGGGMDVMASARAHGAAGTNYVNNPNSNPLSGPGLPFGGYGD